MEEGGLPRMGGMPVSSSGMNENPFFGADWKARPISDVLAGLIGSAMSVKPKIAMTPEMEMKILNTVNRTPITQALSAPQQDTPRRSYGEIYNKISPEMIRSGL